jgi:hypothetical protein
MICYKIQYLTRIYFYTNQTAISLYYFGYIFWIQSCFIYKNRYVVLTLVSVILIFIYRGICYIKGSRNSITFKCSLLQVVCLFLAFVRQIILIEDHLNSLAKLVCVLGKS